MDRDGDPSSHQAAGAEADPERLDRRDGEPAFDQVRVIAVEVPDRPGGLAHILDIMKNQGINVEYMYAFIERSSDNAIIIFRFDELDKAIQTLTGGGVRVLKGEELYAL